MEEKENQDKTQTEPRSYLDVRQADVLNQARLQPLGTSTFIEKPLKNLQRIHELTMKLKNNGLDEDTVTCIGYKLSQLDRETDLHDSQRVKTHIAVIQHFRHKRT
jgi:hypothetical protein